MSASADASYFNPRSREGSDPRLAPLSRTVVYFNPRSREGSDAEENAQSGVQLISIHAPAKGATRSARSPTQGRADFNPRSREGSDQDRPLRDRGHGHFNPRSREGSDADRFNVSHMVSHFNPRSREGSDGRLQTSIRKNYLFQSTLPRRERLNAAVLAPTTTAISIHAPAKGATPYLIWVPTCVYHFNPRSREGSDRSVRSPRRRRDYFNPRSREGSDLSSRSHERPRCYFNPRSREGSDSRSSGRTYPVSSFQSTLPRRERPGDDPPAPHRHDFNPRSREGSDGPTAKREVFRIYFNPRSREGSDLQVR